MQSPNDVIKKNKKILNKSELTMVVATRTTIPNLRSQGPLLPVGEDSGNEVGNNQTYFHTFLFTNIKKKYKKKGHNSD